jgi:tetratricopeptide (TPR) repeat protein
MTEARISLNLRPDDPDTHVVLGMALMTKGQVDEAAVHFSKAVEIRPNHSTAHYNLAIALLEKHETSKAIEQYEKAIEVQPDFLEALTNLSWIFANYPEAAIRNPPKAVELAEKANQLTGGTNPLVLRTLVAAYASNRSFDKALETSRRALQYAQEQHNFEAAEAIRREMSLYEVGQQPYQAH